MLYTNLPLVVMKKELLYGIVTGVAIGEHGRGRLEVFLPTPDYVVSPNSVISELRTDLTIGATRSNRPRIDARKDNNIYLILSSKRSCTRKGNGFIQAPKDQNNELITRGKGADGDARRIGNWSAIIVKANEGDVFRVTWGGFRYGHPATFYVVSGGTVHVADQPDVKGLYKKLGIEMPFSLSPSKNKLVIDADEWKTI